MDKIELIDRAQLMEKLRIVLPCSGCWEKKEPCIGLCYSVKMAVILTPTIDAEWELFQRITDAYYDKQMFFLQDDGSVYDRYEGVYHTSTDAAIDAFILRISEG